jgi:hypothetical protein
MPKKRRQAHIPQQQPPSRRRRVVRRPEAASAPEPGFEPEAEPPTDLDGNPIFADNVGYVTGASAALGGASGPVETRPHWIGSQAQQQTRQPGRRLAQLRGTASTASNAERAPRVTAGQLPTFAAGYLSEELRRIAITAGSLFVLIIVLAVVMR